MILLPATRNSSRTERSSDAFPPPRIGRVKQGMALGTTGHPQIAKLFRAAAAAETVHALAHFRVMKGVGDTKQNLQAAIDGEEYEFKEMYPAFIKAAQADGNTEAVTSFRNANSVEKTHYELYSKALESLTAGKDLAAGPMYVCNECGHTVLGKAPDECPVCGASRSKFKEVA